MKSANRELFGDINITPLTDIFLVLLIIMMVVAPLLDYRGLDMVVATGKAAPPDKKVESKRVWLSIAADGTYLIEGKSVQAEHLLDTIRDSLSAKPDGVIIETDPEANHAALMRAMDAVRSAGVVKVSVVETTPPPVKK
jgi:biopolymer transport protein ExbD/biopolymer transport protein TolR